MVAWHYQLSGHESEQMLGNSEGHGSLVCCIPRSCKDLDMTSLLGLLAEIKWWLRRKGSVYNVGDLGSIPGSGSSLEKETATHSSTLAWKIP